MQSSLVQNDSSVSLISRPVVHSKPSILRQSAQAVGALVMGILRLLGNFVYSPITFCNWAFGKKAVTLPAQISKDGEKPASTSSSRSEQTAELDPSFPQPPDTTASEQSFALTSGNAEQQTTELDPSYTPPKDKQAPAPTTQANRPAAAQTVDFDKMQGDLMAGYFSGGKL